MHIGPVIGFLQRMKAEAPEYVALLGLLIVAMIANMPHPETIQELLGTTKLAQWSGVSYRWMYDSLQAFMAARNPHPPTPLLKKEESNTHGNGISNP
jgi:hypothetical protein